MEHLIRVDGAYLSRTRFKYKKHLLKCYAQIKDTLIEKPPIFIYGKERNQRRDVGFYSDVSEGYHYSNQLMPSQPLSYELEQLITGVNDLLGTNFNSILVNRYNDRDDYLSAHSDDLGPLADTNIASISIGSSRTFRIRNKDTKEIIMDIDTCNDYILLMHGSFQEKFTHEIPKQKIFCDERISFTFRNHII